MGPRPSQGLLFKYFAIVDGWNMNEEFLKKKKRMKEKKRNSLNHQLGFC